MTAPNPVLQRPSAYELCYKFRHGEVFVVSNVQRSILLSNIVHLRNHMLNIW